MDSELASSIVMVDSQSADMYHMLGGKDACRRLVVAFYAQVAGDPVLCPLYFPTFGCALDSLTAFFVQFFGGPGDYTQRRWSLSLRFSITGLCRGERAHDKLNDCDFTLPLVLFVKQFLADLHAPRPIEGYTLHRV